VQLKSSDVLPSCDPVRFRDEAAGSIRAGKSEPGTDQKTM